MSAEIIKNITAAPTTADQNQPPQLPSTDQPELKVVETSPTTPTVEEKPKEVSETDLLTGGKTDNAAPAIPTLPNVEVLPPATDTSKRKPGRPPGAKNKTKADFTDLNTPLVPPVNYDEMSKALFDMTTGVLSNTFGPEWQPQTPDERQNVCTCLSVYLKTKEVKDIPPGLMLTIVVVAYAGPRLAVPTTREKLKPAFLWFWNKVKSFFARKPKLAIVPGPNQPPTP